MKPANVRQFFQQFPDDDACLAHLFNARFGQGHTCPKCERSARWYPIKAEKAFSCQWCGHHIHPMVDTIFEKSRTPLQLWFYAVFLFTNTRHGVSAKELQRQLGVTYKTAYRMGTLIRQHMAAIDGDEPLGGRGKVVEVDESYFGGKGTHTSVSPAYLERSVKEFEYRFNRRMTSETMLSELLSRFPELDA